MVAKGRRGRIMVGVMGAAMKLGGCAHAAVILTSCVSTMANTAIDLTNDA